MGNRYTLSAYKSGAALVKGIQSFDLSPNISMILTGGSGSTDSGFAAIGQIAPQIGFTTTAIKTALALSGINGVAMSNDTFYFIKRAEGGVRATSAHQKIVAAAGLLIPGTLSAPQGQAASLTYKAHPVSADGAASPLAFSTSATIEVGQDIVSEIYTMGPATINGSALSGVSQFNIDFGIEVFAEICDGDVYPRIVLIISRKPTIRITSFDVDSFVTWGLDGVAQGTTDSTVQLLSQDAGGVRGSAPITFTIDDGLVHTENITGDNGQVLGHQAVITPVYDGTNDVIAISGLT